ncbi:MAG: AAA family ATPase, partial [Actinomycetia bacterium]|nr:AAA family ATPase [Actinomycetes bacterium]
MTCSACGRQAGESDRFCAGCGAPLATGGTEGETRKRVSMLFLDIVGSTTLAERLDPEPLRQVMDRYFASCGARIAEHGGAVEKFIGDAILAGFGVTVAHEDDALRAVRAATGALAALADLTAELGAQYQVELEARAGICTGDVMVITGEGGYFRVIGDSVNTAARLQTAAAPGEVLICADTAAVVRRHVGLQAVEPMELKGKARPVPAWRVTALASAADTPEPVPFIGRTDELEELERSLRRTRTRRQACLATVIGAPGIGKSRLVQEFLAQLPDGEVTVLTGRCSAYGRGITYRPLAEMLGSLPGGRQALPLLLRPGGDDASPSPAHGLVARTLGTVLDAEADAARAGAEDIAWAVRHLLEVLGRSRTVVMVWEDLHWSEETLLDLIDDVATWLQDVPVLLLCVARPELVGVRGAWGGGKPCATTLELGPMSTEQTTALVGRLAERGDVHPQDYQEVNGTVVELCDGNPLFAEQLMDVLAGSAPDPQIPPTIQALLGARLDQLPRTERTLLELAAVIGREFTPDLLRSMASADGVDTAATDRGVARLSRRRLLERGPGGTHRFTQALLRETAYECTAKARREHWHDFLAGHLAAQPGQDPVAVAYHVEAAFRLRRELRPGDARLPALAGVAADTLVAEGMNALSRKDLPAAVQLLERGRELLPAGDRRHTTLALHLCDAGLWLQDPERCHAALAAAEAALPGDIRNATVCAIQRSLVGLRLGLDEPAEVTARSARLAEQLGADPDDDLGWCRLEQLRAHLELAAEKYASAEASFARALKRARRTADAYEDDRLLAALCELAQWAPTPVAAGLELCDALAARFAAGRSLLLPVLVTRAHLQALSGDIDGARHTLDGALAYSHQDRLDLADAVVLDAAGFVESLAGAHEAAEARYRQSLGVLRTTPHAVDTRGTEVAIARALFAQGRVDAARTALDRIEEQDADAGHPGLRARLGAAALRGRIASARGRHEEAVAAAVEARALCTSSDDLCLTGETLFDLAVVLRAAGDPARAAAAAVEALRCFEAKGAALPAGQVRGWLAA